MDKDWAGLLLAGTSLDGWKISRVDFAHIFAVLSETDLYKGVLRWSCEHRGVEKFSYCDDGYFLGRKDMSIKKYSSFQVHNA